MTQLEKEIREALLKDEIHYSDAFDKIKTLPKAWARKEWKENRNKLIKDYCEKCDSKTPPFVIQHLKHPDSFRNIYDTVMVIMCKKEMDTMKEKIKNVDTEKYLNQMAEIRDGCPTCKKITLRYRKNINPHYVCAQGHKFNIPEKITYYAKCQTTVKELAISRAKESLRTQIKRKEIKKIRKKYDRQIGRIALLEAMRQSEVYMSMVDTKTYCKSCAFKEDCYLC